MEKEQPDSPVKGITQEAFHIVMWVLVIAGIIGNTFVILWRCCRKHNGFSFLSVLIVSLAVADLLFCFHFMLQEMLVVDVVFNGNEQNHTYSYSDAQLCLASTFTFYVSCNAVVLTAAGIALYTLFAVKGRRCDKAFSVFMVICWLVCVTVAGLGTWSLKTFLRDNKEHKEMSSAMFSLDIMFGCNGDANMLIVPVIIASLNVAASIICSILYRMVCVTLRKTVVHFENSELKRLKVRLAVIALINLFCWWPACALYWYSYFSNNTVFNGRLDPDITKPAFLLAAIVSAVNPVVYTIASKPVLKLARRICVVCLKRRSEERRPFLDCADGDPETRCRRLVGARRHRGLQYEICEVTTSNETEPSSLFPESQTASQTESLDDRKTNSTRIHGP